jgi:hypothetical protein
LQSPISIVGAVSFALSASVVALVTHADPSAAPAPAAIASAAPTASQIYANAVHEMLFLEAQGAPPYLVYDLHIDSHNLHWYPATMNGESDWDAKLVHANETDDYRVWYRTKDQRALVQDATTHASFKGDAPFAPDTADPTQFTKPSPSPNPSATPMSGSDGIGAVGDSTEVIGAVSVNASRYYDVTLIGVEMRDGAPVYHLHLHAIRDSEDYPLTDLWVDTRDYRVRAAHGEFTIRAVAAGFGMGIDADWAPAGDRWLVTSIDFTGKGYVMLWHLDVASAMTTRIVDVPASLPAVYFSK